jgi:hypothetical protein
MCADVEVIIGDIDKIAVEVTCDDVVEDLLKVSANGATDSVSVCEVARPASLHPTTVSHAKSSVKAWIPERFCNVEVVSNGGAVHVSGVTEGCLKVCN